MVELLGAEHPLVKQILNGKTPEAKANELIEGTKLEDVAFRKQLAAGGSAAIAASTDPMIVLARMIRSSKLLCRAKLPKQGPLNLLMEPNYEMWLLESSWQVVERKQSRTQPTR